MSEAFKTIAEDVLLLAGDVQRESSAYSVDFLNILEALDFSSLDDRASQLIAYLESKSWVEDETTHSGPALKVTGSGYIEIDRIKNERKPRGVKDHIASINRSDWISFGALVTSIIALFRS